MRCQSDPPWRAFLVKCGAASPADLLDLIRASCHGSYELVVLLLCVSKTSYRLSLKKPNLHPAGDSQSQPCPHGGPEVKHTWFKDVNALNHFRRKGPKQTRIVSGMENVMIRS